MMIRQELLKRICPYESRNKCLQDEISCDTCAKITNSLLDEYTEQIRAEMYAEIKELTEKRECEKCRYGSCDDCEKCCEVSALDWLLEQLKERK